jgi:hypothetical protein
MESPSIGTGMGAMGGIDGCNKRAKNANIKNFSDPELSWGGEKRNTFHAD